MGFCLGPQCCLSAKGSEQRHPIEPDESVEEPAMNLGFKGRFMGNYKWSYK